MSFLLYCRLPHLCSPHLLQSLRLPSLLSSPLFPPIRRRLRSLRQPTNLIRLFTLTSPAGRRSPLFSLALQEVIFEKESWDMNTPEMIEAASKKKEEGNILFKAVKYARASKRYEKAVKYIEYDSSFSDEKKTQAKIYKIACNLNNAACKLKLKEYKEAETLCTKVLELDSGNVKTFYRRAQAYINLVDFDLAKFDTKKALEFDPDNRDVKLEYKKLKERVKEYNKKDTKSYGNMFVKLNKLGSQDTYVICVLVQGGCQGC